MLKRRSSIGVSPIQPYTGSEGSVGDVVPKVIFNVATNLRLPIVKVHIVVNFHSSLLNFVF